ncbi:hypothetical protein K7432_012227 [Basidiobolus ranarum]|uniref:Endonuclease/exonuclease/phosphatase domain-containing protein n=1 Tax=Basidiobolus ranarum TaxID=34480 RepID=A0ABR2WL68_9FUNG
MNEHSGMYTFANGQWEPHKTTQSTNLVNFQQLKVVTYNIHFETQNYETRMNGIIHELQQQDADVVCLQEMIPLFLPVFTKNIWIQENYILSDWKEGKSLRPYGVLILTKLKHVRIQLRTIDMVTNMNRKLQVLDTTINGHKIHFATAHFESLEYNKHYRRNQFLQAMRDSVHYNASAAILVGDFNMSHEDEEDAVFDCYGFSDCWDMLRPNDLGHTMGINIPHPQYGPIRFDRVKLWQYQDILEPISIETFGDKPIPLEILGDTVVSSGYCERFPSDHLGICAIFKVNVEA